MVMVMLHNVQFIPDEGASRGVAMCKHGPPKILKFVLNIYIYIYIIILMFSKFSLKNKSWPP